MDERYDKLLALFDKQEPKLYEYMNIVKTLSLQELRDEFLSSLKYAKKTKEELAEIKLPDDNSHNVNAYADLSNRYYLIMYQYVTLFAYCKKLESKLLKKERRKVIKMLDRQLSKKIKK